MFEELEKKENVVNNSFNANRDENVVGQELPKPIPDVIGGEIPVSGPDVIGGEINTPEPDLLGADGKPITYNPEELNEIGKTLDAGLLKVETTTLLPKKENEYEVDLVRSTDVYFFASAETPGIKITLVTFKDGTVVAAPESAEMLVDWNYSINIDNGATRTSEGSEHVTLMVTKEGLKAIANQIAKANNKEQTTLKIDDALTVEARYYIASLYPQFGAPEKISDANNYDDNKKGNIDIELNTIVSQTPEVNTIKQPDVDTIKETTKFEGNNVFVQYDPMENYTDNYSQETSVEDPKKVVDINLGGAPTAYAGQALEPPKQPNSFPFVPGMEDNIEKYKDAYEKTEESNNIPVIDGNLLKNDIPYNKPDSNSSDSFGGFTDGGSGPKLI